MGRIRRLLALCAATQAFAALTHNLAGYGPFDADLPYMSKLLSDLRLTSRAPEKLMQHLIQQGFTGFMLCIVWHAPTGLHVMVV